METLQSDEVVQAAQAGLTVGKVSYIVTAYRDRFDPEAFYTFRVTEKDGTERIWVDRQCRDLGRGVVEFELPL